MVRTNGTDKTVFYGTDKIINKFINPAPNDNMILHQSRFHCSLFRFQLRFYHLFVAFGY